MIIRNVNIYDAIKQDPYQGDIVIENGKLVSVGGTGAVASGEEIDGRGLNAYPGFVEAHSHIGLDDYGGVTGATWDYNEMNDICCPQLRGMDSYYPMDAAIPMALAGGDDRCRRPRLRERAGRHVPGNQAVRKNR